jgi:ATP/maltotriose-dependent transcriptional regulator MalT
MLGTVREFVAERLGARPNLAEIGRRHAEYYRGLAEQADRPLRGVRQGEWFERLEAEAGNLAAAVGWYLARDPIPLPHLFRVLWLFWSARDHLGEARGWVDQLLPAADALDPQARAELAWTAPVVGDLDGALRGALASLEQLRGQDEPFWTALAVGTAGMVETIVGRHDDAQRHLREARDLGKRFDDAWLGAWSRVELGTLAVVRGRLEEARALLEEGLELSLAAHSTRSVTLCLAAFARLALVEGDAERAALLAGAAEGLRRRVGLRALLLLRRPEAELVAQVRQALGADRFEEVVAAGARLTQREAVTAVRDRRGAGAAAS